eukprot:TRINITY_DN70237_c0_g1_i1.p1 TRINITY_DN70237_c0_g1~~TRINITY_DN70237_c0_g1_i1.p1  ORF type:complete len:237 (+),score=76.99 TRINITY_DN70237_c0_g1_i1:77-712(+)
MDPREALRELSMCRPLLVQAGVALFGLDVLNSPHLADPKKVAKKDFFSFLSDVWDTAWYWRALAWAVLVHLPVSFALTHRAKPRRDAFADLAWTELAGAGIFAVGYALRLWAKRTLGKSFTYMLAQPDRLVDSGPYRVLVHPSYSGALLYVFGLYQFGGASLLTTLCAVGVGVYLLGAKRIPQEEVMLRECFGKDFDAFAAARWRLVPFLY